MVAKAKQVQCTSALFDPSLPATCDLYKTCKSPFMAMSGNVNAEILFIGEGPGAEEDVAGQPFVGDSGKLLRHAMKLANVTDFAMTNAVRCRPPGNRDPKTIELKTCQSFMYTDIGSMPNLKLLVVLGNHAMFSVLGHKGILEASGTLTEVTINKKTYSVLCVMHPSYVLQNPKQLNNFMNHIGRIPNALTGKLVDPADEGVYYVINSKYEWQALADKLESSKEFIYDLETNALDPYFPNSEITCISFCINQREAYSVDMINLMLRDIIYPRLKMIMENPHIHKVGHNIKFDNLWMREKLGIKVEGTTWDTQTAQYLVDENESHGLKSLAWKHTRLGGYEDRLVQSQPHLHTGSNLLHYSSIDVDVTKRILDILRPQVCADKGLERLNRELLIPVSDILLEIERVGLPIDLVRLEDCKKKVDAYLHNLYQSIMQEKSVKKFEKASGKTFNPRSSDMLRSVLFDYEKLESIKKTAKAKKESTDREVLEFHKDQSSLCALLVDHSLYSSMKSKMIKELEEYTVGGRIHTHFWLTETSTGRSSSDDPNLQNVTKGKKDVVGIRKCFIADPGFDLLEIDYNQHELRCMADLAEDMALYKSILSGDVHTATASTILQKLPALVSEDERRDVGKTFNFGFIYGLTKWGIIRRLKCTDSQAQTYLDRFFNLYSKTKLYMDATTLFVNENGYVKSRTGRYRRFPIWNELDDKSVREAINMPVQSLAGDILLYSLMKVFNFLKEVHAKTYMCLEIHDSLLLMLHKQEHFLLKPIKEIMLNEFRKFIPFTLELAVDMKIGPDWGSMEKVDV